jgi:ATP-dependent helicase/nuclease subunit B
MRSTTFPTLEPALLERSDGAIVVTANDRLSAALTDAFATHGIDSAPRILPLGDYLRARFAELSSQQDVGLLLSPLAQRFAWIERAPLLPDFDPDNVYREIASAWSSVHDWNLLEHLGEFDDNENHRVFRDWAFRYIGAAKAHRWVTEAELAGIVSEAIRRGVIHADSLLLVGFDVVCTSLRRLIDAVRSAGRRVNVHRSSIAHASATVFWTYDDPDRELAAAIRWAGAIVDSDVSQTACIVVPDASVDHDALVGRLDDLLGTDDAYSVASDSRYNVSGGIPLGSLPVVADAIRLLRWTTAALHHSEVERLLRSPFLALAIDARTARAPDLPETYSAATLTRARTTSPLFDIVGIVRGIGLLRLDTAVQRVRHILQRAGWPNAARLTGESHQAVASFESMLDEIAKCASVTEPRDLTTALARIAATAARRNFAPARPPARLQVLGALETVGLRFTHLWVTGLDDARWPAAPHPNPFIPLRLQRSVGMPRSDVESEFVFARRMTDHWCSAANEVVFSHARHRDGEPRRASRLVSVAPAAADESPPGPARGHPFLRRTSSAVLQTRTEPAVGPIRPERLRHRGSRILRDQSACAFRAFARYRLFVESPRSPHSFPDAADRGIAVHAAMRALFEPVGDSLWTETRQGEAVARAAEVGMNTADRWSEAFRAAETDRLRRLLEEWIEVDRARPAFRTIAVERATTLSLDGFEFSLQIDRIDRAGDEIIVLDYKTGDVSAKAVFGERPEEPQLPMYALATAQSTSIAFAELRPGQCRLDGWASRPQSAKAFRLRLPLEKDGDWDRMKETWRRRLLALTHEFVSGVADVRPRDSRACQECDLHALCRIREIDRIVTD